MAEPRIPSPIYYHVFGRDRGALCEGPAAGDLTNGACIHGRIYAVGGQNGWPTRDQLAPMLPGHKGDCTCPACANERILKDAPLRLCAAGCGLAAEPGDIYCSGDREGVDLARERGL